MDLSLLGPPEVPGDPLLLRLIEVDKRSISRVKIGELGSSRVSRHHPSRAPFTCFRHNIAYVKNIARTLATNIPFVSRSFRFLESSS